MKNITFSLIFFFNVTLFANAQVLPIMPSKPKSAADTKHAPRGQPKVIVKSNDRDGDGLANHVDRCPDQKGTLSNYGCPEQEKKNYAFVTIGSQVWMQKNLDVDCFRNGDIIPEVKSNEEWVRYGNEGKPAWCYYNNDPSSGNIYGKLYNWYAVMDSRGLAPTGWIIPGDWEWYQASELLGGDNDAGGGLKAISHWSKPNQGATKTVLLEVFKLISYQVITISICKMGNLQYYRAKLVAP